MVYFNNIKLRGNDTITLPILTAMGNEPYILRNVDGLGPPDMSVNLSTGLYGANFYQGRYLSEREITLTIRLNQTTWFSDSISQLRERLYGLISAPSGDLFTVAICDDDADVMTARGVFKSIEINPFSKEPQAQVIIVCPSPWFEGPEVVVDSDWSNTLVVNNVGQVNTGFTARLKLGATNLAHFVLAHEESNKMMKFLSTEQLAVDSYIDVITERGGRRVINRDNPVYSNWLLASLSPLSDWLELYQGVNTFKTSGQGSAPGTGNVLGALLINQIKYTPKYWGI